MSQQLEEFVKQSGIKIQRSNSPNSISTTASNNNLARELELDLLKKQEFPPRLERNFISNTNYGEFAQFMNNSNSNDNYNKLENGEKRMINNVLADINFNNLPKNENVTRALLVPPPIIELSVSKLNPGMFNATVNKEFPQQGDFIDLKKILLKVPQPKTPIGEGLYIETKEIIGRYGAMQEGFSHTREYGKRGNINRSDFFTVQFKVIISNGTESKGATVNFYKNGKIRFSGGFIGTNIANQPELIRRFIVNTYSEKEAFLYNAFEYNNLSGQFRINGNFKGFSMIASQRQRVYASAGVTKLDFEPELSPFMYVHYKGHKYIFSQSGNVQVSGAPNPAAMLAAYNDGVELVTLMNTTGDIEVTGEVPKKLTKGARVPQTRGPKKKTGPRVVTKRVAPTKKREVVFNIQINGVQCMRFSKPDLVDFAKKLGIVGITQSTKKEDICMKINKILNKNSTTFKNTNKKKDVKLTGSGNTFRVGGKICGTGDMNKKELLRIAAILKIKLDDKETKETICKKIQKVKNEIVKQKAIPKPAPKPKEPKRVQVERAKNVKKQQVMKKRGLDENSIRKDITKIYGDKWMKRYNPNINQDVRNMKSALNTVNNKNKLGIPFKKNIDMVKKNVVGRWKMERKRELERKYLMNKVNVNGVALNLKNDYRRAAANYIMSKKIAPSEKKMKEYREYWLKFRPNAMRSATPTKINRSVKARVEKM